MPRDRKPTRLDTHRARFHKESRLGPLLRLSDLSSDEMQHVSSAVFDAIRAAKPGSDEYYRIYLAVLYDWGLVCPHPEEKRSYKSPRGLESDPGAYPWFACAVCGCVVLDAQWMAANPSELATYSVRRKIEDAAREKRSWNRGAQPGGISGSEGSPPEAS